MLTARRWVAGSMAAAALGSSPTHLVRSFGAEFGIAPHRYLTGRRLDQARRLLLELPVVSEQLGHSTTTLTRDTYQSVVKQMHHNAAAAVAKKITRKRRKTA